MSRAPSRKRLSWEASVEWLRRDPAQQQLAMACYYDDPVEAALERFFQGDEFAGVRRLLPPLAGLDVLDIGAGRGIASYALARSGAHVTALEPDPSAIVGASAIRGWAKRLSLPVNVVSEWGESLPFTDQAFDIVYARAVLHHAHDLQQLCSEVRRVLKPGGLALACREHVVTNASQHARFLAAHPLHHLYGGENAYPLTRYLRSLESAGLDVEVLLGPHDSVINHAPMDPDQHDRFVLGRLQNIPGLSWAARHTPLGGSLRRLRSLLDRTPGRHFTFLARRT